MPTELHGVALPGGAELRFSDDARETLHRHRQTGRKSEAGGILLGKIYENGDVTVTLATVPGPGDRRGRLFFDRCRQRAQQIVDDAWTASAGEIQYLGEWHSHPQCHPQPSGRDKYMIENMLRETRMDLTFLLLVIVGLDEDWIGIRTNGSLSQLNTGSVAPAQSV